MWNSHYRFMSKTETTSKYHTKVGKSHLFYEE